ncbi:apolipoprotein L3-like [Suncus etruscus]|uniref:apolipoprotein L3-like n=1 Tax=Suncus etruscus TaxID=109475 RepID=UPI00210FD911|nr:apolipoprotein L3-like [Suncus etruscus]
MEEAVNPEDFLGDSSSFIEYAIRYIQENLSAEDICSLLSEDDIWEDFVVKAQFSREEAEEVLEGLLVQETFRTMEDEDIYQQEQVYKERFLKEFPKMKQELEEHMAQLRALADKADKLHRGCAISSLVAGSTSIVSGILTIIGIGLAPVTAGVSLGLTAAGMGLGAASAVTEVTTRIVEHANMAVIETDANKLTSTEVNPEEALKGVVRDIGPKLAPLGKNIVKNMGSIEKNIRAIQLIKTNPRLTARAMRFMNSGRISARNARQVQKAFGGTALAMTKGARMAGMATAGLFLLTDLYSVVKQSIHLQKGAKTESADRLREQASELEKTLEDLKEIYVILLED